MIQVNEATAGDPVVNPARAGMILHMACESAEQVA